MADVRLAYGEKADEIWFTLSQEDREDRGALKTIVAKKFKCCDQGAWYYWIHETNKEGSYIYASDLLGVKETRKEVLSFVDAYSHYELIEKMKKDLGEAVVIDDRTV